MIVIFLFLLFTLIYLFILFGLQIQAETEFKTQTTYI